ARRRPWGLHPRRRAGPAAIIGPGAVPSEPRHAQVPVFRERMTTPVEITWLLAARAKGAALAFGRLYGAPSAKLYGVVLRILRRHDLATGVIEDAYLQIWRSAGEF